MHAKNQDGSPSKISRLKNKRFVHGIFTACAILRSTLASGIKRARLVIEIWIHSTNACILAKGLAKLGNTVAETLL